MKRRRDMQIAYIADQSVMEEMAKCRKILQKLNFADRSDFDGISGDSKRTFREIRKCLDQSAFLLRLRLPY